MLILDLSRSHPFTNPVRSVTQPGRLLALSLIIAGTLEPKSIRGGGLSESTFSPAGTDPAAEAAGLALAATAANNRQSRVASRLCFQLTV